MFNVYIAYNVLYPCISARDVTDNTNMIYHKLILNRNNRVKILRGGRVTAHLTKLLA